MGGRISSLVAATTSAVILALLIPLGLLVRGLAEDRATAAADTEARNIAILVSSLHDDPSLQEAVATLDARSSARTCVILAEGIRFGSGRVPLDDPDIARARTGSAFTTSQGGGRRTVVPVLTANGTDVVVTEVSESQLRQGVARAWTVLSVLGLLMLATALLIAGGMGRRISTPLTRVAETADQLREGDLSARARIEGPAETRALAVALNRLGERINELLLAERAAVGDLSHRLRTPVTALRIDIETLADRDLAHRLGHHVAILQRTIDAIVKDARRPIRNAIEASCDSSKVVRERVTFWSALAEDQRRPLEVDLAAGPLIVALDPGDLGDVVDILIDNVFAHTAEEVGFSITLSRQRDTIELTITDLGGAGLIHPHDDPGHSGLGLQIARRTIGAAGGTLDVVAMPSGTAVTVCLPVNTAARPL